MDEAWVSVVLFEYRNVENLGVDTSDGSGYPIEDLGQFIINNRENLYAPIVTQKINLKKPTSIHYPVKKSGYYCVSAFTLSDTTKFTAPVVFQNAFGHLPASQVPKLSFYAGAAIAYAVVLGFWLFSYVRFRNNILPVQNYITAICGFLVIEMIVIWGYYEFLNRHGESTGGNVYLVVLSIFNSFRNAFTFFLLLIVCLGYGVVKPSLGDLMWKCRALAVAHFLFAILYTVSSYIVPPDSTSPWILLVILPLSLTMTGFYIWILSSLSHTIKFLEDRKQHVKALMYKNLWRLLLGSVLVIFGFFFLNSLIFANESPLEFITNHWQSRWFMLDGWLNVVYFVDFCIIAFIWRPTENNRRFAMSTQLAQDENEAQEFEIGTLGGSDDEDDNNFDMSNNNSATNFNNNSQTPRPTSPPPQYSAPMTSSGKASESAAKAEKGKDATNSSNNNGESSSSNAQGGTVFSVTDEDNGYSKWDDDDDDDSILSADDYENDDNEATGLRKKK
ncbi:hypothetical protein DV451_000390 [Geotrichum candidum]|uniref:Uncharacterized protein n=1 Tax=Geotrichum candidum TaxID=1173061 RepID=A0A9P5KVN4_GEOCN|nr:hypothetical protein DV451_000390 [Geotrichum candidum]KAF5107456.1 hypothetical protein DV453_003111 [Geotrichum candidum]